MWPHSKYVVAVMILCGLATSLSWAQRKSQSEHSGAIPRRAEQNDSPQKASVASEMVSPDDGLAVIAAALDSRVRIHAKRDCSHLVHAIYDRAGFPYSYASSSDLYAGTPEFERVAHPQPGDLIVWRGHVGIVVNPAQHVFFSAMRSGMGIDAYDAPYWKRFGKVRFYRYNKDSIAQNASDARDRGRVLQTHRAK
jgi:cell wall-associated NlpC family hydrolase